MGTSAFDRLWGDDDPKKKRAPSVPVAAPVESTSAAHAAPHPAGFDALWDGLHEHAAAHPAPESGTEHLRGVVQSAFQGLTGGLGNKTTAATRAVLPQWLGGTKGFNYDQALTEERTALDNFRQRHPYEAAFAEGAGGVPLAMAAGPGSVPLKAAGSMRVGAAMGGIYGAGELDNPTPAQLALHTGKGMATGAALVGAIHGAGHATSGFLDTFGIRPSETGTSPVGRIAKAAGVQTVEERAPRIILNRLGRSGTSLDDLARAHADATAINKPASLVELGGRPMARLARGTQGIPGKGAEQVAAMLESRRAGAPVRVAGDVEQGLGQPSQDLFEVGQKLSQAQQAKATPLYTKAMRAQPVGLDAPVPGHDNLALGDLMKRPSIEKAMGYGKQLAHEEGGSFPDIAGPNVSGQPASELLAKMSPEARARFTAAAKAQGVELSPSVPFEQLHNLKLRLDEMIGYAKANGKMPDGTPATKKMLRAVQDTKNSLLSVMDAHEPAYKEARGIWAGDEELKDGLALGHDFFNAKRPLGELKHELGSLSAAGQEQTRVGVVAAVREKIDAAPDGADVVRRIFGNEAQRQRLRAAFPSDQAFDQFAKQMQMESLMAKNETMILGNSQTAEKGADAADIMGRLPTTTLSVRGVGKALLDSRLAMRAKKLAEQRVDGMSPFLTANTPEAREAMLRQLRAALGHQIEEGKVTRTHRALAEQSFHHWLEQPSGDSHH